MDTELNSTSECADQPKGIKITLKQHQLSLLARCRELEKDEYYHCENENIRTSVGIIGDKVGAGKSYVILSLCCEPLTERNDIMYTSFGLNLITQITQVIRDTLKTCVIVIPHNIFSQWSGYIKNTTLNALYVNKSKHIDTITKEKCAAADIILLTNTMYNAFVVKCSNLNICFSRVFYDEADNIKINACNQLNAKFYWLITASIANLKYPNGMQVYNPGIGRYVFLANGIKTRGFIKDLCSSLSKSQRILHAVIAKNSDLFVDESLNLPLPEVNQITCKTPYYINILHHDVDYNIIRCLNANDYKGALSYINPNQKDTEENIINLMLEKYNNNIHNLRIRLNYVNNVIYDNPSEKDQIVHSLNIELDKINSKINNIKQRIKETNQCPICYEICANKCIMKCCQNSFCFNCLSTWLQNKKLCPMCKSNQTINNILIVDETASTSSAAPPKPIVVKSKIEVALDIINDNNIRNKRIIVLSEFEGVLLSLEKELVAQNIQYGYLKGHQATIDKLLDKFNSAEINILLVNPTFYGSGMNLEETTDIIMFHKFNAEMEKQVIGRAQRLGRKNNLKLWYLLYENEKNH
jgi:hypothetical protein